MRRTQRKRPGSSPSPRRGGTAAPNPRPDRDTATAGPSSDISPCQNQEHGKSCYLSSPAFEHGDGVTVSIEKMQDVGPSRIEIAYERLGDPHVPPVLMV